MSSKYNGWGPDRILLCNDEILESAVKITDVRGIGGGIGDGDGDVNGNGFGFGYVTGYGSKNGDS
jgi:hypothetical protein